MSSELLDRLRRYSSPKMFNVHLEAKDTMAEAAKRIQELEQDHADYVAGHGYADALVLEFKQKIEELEARMQMLQDLVNESDGVAGWHQNGEVATWDEVGIDEILVGEVTDSE